MNLKDHKQRPSTALISRDRWLTSVSLRMFFLVPYVVLILVTVSSVGYFSFLNGQAAVNSVAASLRDSIALRVKEHVLAFLEIPHQITQTNADIIHRSLMDTKDVNLMQHYFLAQIQAYPSISSIYFGNANGGIIGSGREGAGSAFYTYSTANLQAGIFKKYSVDSQGNTADLLTTVPNFDARTRPWYLAAQQKGGAVWSDVYILSTGQDMAIAESQPVYDANQNLVGVISVDIFVSQVSQFLQTLDISAVGQIFNIDSTGALVADSTGESMFSDSTGTGQLNRISGQDSKSAIIRESSQFLLKKYGAFQNIPPGLQQLELTINGEKQFLQLLPINDQYGLQWVVAVVVPESAYMAQITHNNDVTFEIVIAALAIVFIINITTTERIIRRVSQLNHFAQAIAKGQWNHDHLPLSKINELDSLATSFHQMHSQLYQTLKNLTVEIDERKRVEHILRQSEGYLRSLVDSQATFTIRINMKGNISYCNERYATQFQWLEPSLIGATVLNMILAEDHEKMQQGIIQCESCVGTPVQVELRQLTPNDSQFWTHWELMAVPDSEGVVTEIQCVGIDITQQKLAEAELQALNASLEQRVIDRTFELEQTKNRLEAIFNHSDYGIVLVNVQDGIQQANLAFETLFGATRDGYLGAKLSTFVEADYVTLIESNVQKVAALRQVQRLELLGKRCDSLSFEIEISLAPISHFEEAVTNLVCIIHDISERKKSEIALRASEERFRRFIEMAPIAVVAANQDGELVLSNHETEALFGYAPDELSGQPMEVLIPEKAQVVYSDHQTNFMAGSETHRKQSLELAGQRKDGSKFPVDIKLTHVDLPEGSLELAYIVDITQQKMAETALKQALAHEKELGDFKTRFISIASHEFRTPLATILATTETLTFYRDKLDDAKINDRLDKIKQQVRHLTHIMEDVLQLSKMQAKRVQYKPIQGDLAALCGDIVEEFEVQAQYRGRILYEFTTRSVLLKYDVHLMRQIIGNLISNALKYSPAEKNIYITLAHDSTDVTLKVRDEGIGIPPNDLNHLFEAFHRASNVGTISGTGLGLSITKQAIELHKGTITVESQVGIGTTFIVTIPKPVD